MRKWFALYFLLLVPSVMATPQAEGTAVPTADIVSAPVNADVISVEAEWLRFMPNGEGIPAADLWTTGAATVYFYDVNNAGIIEKRYGPFYMRFDAGARSPIPAGKDATMMQIDAVEDTLFTTPRSR